MKMASRIWVVLAFAGLAVLSAGCGDIIEAIWGGDPPPPGSGGTPTVTYTCLWSTGATLEVQASTAYLSCDDDGFCDFNHDDLVDQWWVEISSGSVTRSDFAFANRIALDCMESCGAEIHGPLSGTLCEPPALITKDESRSGTSRDPLVVSSRTPNNSFRGSLWAEHSSVTISSSSIGTVSVPVNGEVWLKGGDCTYRDCPVELTCLRLENTAPLTVEGVRISQATFFNQGHWSGTKRADGSLALFPSAELFIRATLDGDTRTLRTRSSEPMAGWHDFTESNDLGAPHLVLAGTYTGGHKEIVTVSLELTFRDDNLGPKARFEVVPRHLSHCTDLAGSGDLVLDARASYHPLGHRIVRYRWTDGNGELLGETHRKCLRVGCEVGPIHLEVEDENGNISWQESGAYPLRGFPRPNEKFGSAVASGDFNQDGFLDLVVGIPGDTGTEDIADDHMYCGHDPDSPVQQGVSIRAGAVQVFFGGVWGLTGRGNELWHQDLSGVRGVRAQGDQFGRAVAVGDFDDDGYDDIAIGVPDKSLTAGVEKEGMVNVLYGSASGMNSRGGSSKTYFYQSRSGVLEHGESDDAFGSALASGDFNGDGTMDLAVGVPGEDNDAGAVQIFYGSNNGLTSQGDTVVRRRSLTTRAPSGSKSLVRANAGPGTSYPVAPAPPVYNPGLSDIAGLRFGHSLASADLNADGYADLVVGAPGSGSVSAEVLVIFGSAGGISTSGYFRIDEESLPDVSQGKFGTSLAVGLFNNDEHMDIAVGSPMARVGSQSFAGSVTLFFGSASGFSMDEHEIVTQNTYYHGGGVQDRAEYLDQFGYSLAAGRINDDRFDDLVVGAAGETNSEASMAGAVHVLYNDSRQRNVFDLRKDKLLSQQNLPGDSPEDIDFFGYALALGDYDRNGFDDLAVGVPYDSLDGYSDAGIVQVSYSDATGGLNTDPAPDDHPTLQNIDQGGSSTADWPAEGPY